LGPLPPQIRTGQFFPIRSFNTGFRQSGTSFTIPLNLQTPRRFPPLRQTFSIYSLYRSEGGARSFSRIDLGSEFPPPPPPYLNDWASPAFQRFFSFPPRICPAWGRPVAGSGPLRVNPPTFFKTSLFFKESSPGRGLLFCWMALFSFFRDDPCSNSDWVLREVYGLFTHCPCFFFPPHISSCLLIVIFRWEVFFFSIRELLIISQRTLSFFPLLLGFSPGVYSTAETFFLLLLNSRPRPFCCQHECFFSMKDSLFFPPVVFPPFPPRRRDQIDPFLPI